MKTVRAFHETGRLFPQRAWSGAWAGTIKWGKLTHARVAQVLKNPTFAGVYTFGKTRDVRRVLPDGTVRSTRRRRAREEWAVLIEDHHDGYISWQDFLITEAKLAANNTKRGARPVREGHRPVPGHHHVRNLRRAGRYPLQPQGSQGDLRVRRAHRALPVGHR